MATQLIDAPASPGGPVQAAPLIDRIPPIPAQNRRHGPLTVNRLRRFYTVLAAIFLLGLAPSVLGMSAQWKAFGLGIVFPGGGFLYAGGIVGVVGALLSLAAFAVIMFIWWARGPILGPPGVLVGTALLSAAWIQGGEGVAAMEYAIPAGVVALHGYLLLKRRARFARQQA
jgi:hypothetical protein